MSEAEFDPVDYAQEACREAGLTASQVTAVQAYLVGIFASYVDTDPVRLSAARWRRYVQDAITEASA